MNRIGSTLSALAVAGGIALGASAPALAESVSDQVARLHALADGKNIFSPEVSTMDTRVHRNHIDIIVQANLSRVTDPHFCTNPTSWAVVVATSLLDRGQGKEAIKLFCGLSTDEQAEFILRSNGK